MNVLPDRLNEQVTSLFEHQWPILLVSQSIRNAQRWVHESRQPLAKRFWWPVFASGFQISKEDMNQVDSFDMDRLSGSLQYEEDSMRQAPTANEINAPPAVIQDKKKTKKEVISLSVERTIQSIQRILFSRRRISNERNGNVKERRRKHVNNSWTRTPSIAPDQPIEF